MVFIHPRGDKSEVWLTLIGRRPGSFSGYKNTCFVHKPTRCGYVYALRLQPNRFGVEKFLNCVGPLRSRHIALQIGYKQSVRRFLNRRRFEWVQRWDSRTSAQRAYYNDDCGMSHWLMSNAEFSGEASSSPCLVRCNSLLGGPHREDSPVLGYFGGYPHAPQRLPEGNLVGRENGPTQSLL